MKLVAASVLSTITVLSACGGGSTGTASFSQTGQISISDLNDAGDAYFAFAQAAEGADVDGLSVDDLTAQGSASYAGYMLAVPSGSLDALVGRTRINADFTNGGTLTGGVTDLIVFPETDAVSDILTANTADGFDSIPAGTAFTELAGELALSNGSIRSVNGVAAIDVAVTGNVEIPRALLGPGLLGVEEFDVTGNLVGAVADTGEFVAEGNLDAGSPVFNFNLESVIFAE